MRNQNNVKKAAALPQPADRPALQQGQSSRHITLPIDPAAQRQAIRDVFVNTVGANVLAKQLEPFVSDGNCRTNPSAAELFMQSIRESVQPRDAIEEMLVVQMAWAHARLARLSAIAHNQEQRGNVQVVHDACDRAANTFRRQMLALAEYRRPPQSNNFMAIRQANLANQQVVQNVQGPNLKNERPSNEQGSAPATLPPVAEGFEVPPLGRSKESAVAVQQRSENPGRQRSSEDERAEARGT
jgi:hypothetical protein